MDENRGCKERSAQSERTPRRSWLGGCLLLAAASACAEFDVQGQDEGDQDVVEAREQPLLVLRSAVWANPEISVCWESDGDEIEKTWVRQSVEQAWQRYSGVRFSGWETCTSAGASLRIRTADEWPHTLGLGNQLDHVAGGMVLNFVFEFSQPDINGTPQQPFAGCQDGGREGCIRSIAVHEFGHALGFGHEQDRADTPDSCTAGRGQTRGDIELGDWDLMSVMNYCNPQYNNRGLLSAADIAGAVHIYGLPAVASLCRTEGTLYTRTGETCSDDPTLVAQCRLGDTQVSLELGVGAWKCGSHRSRWPEVRVERGCRSDSYVMCNALGNPADPANKDFDGNGRSDLLWRDPVSGELSIWYGSDEPGTMEREARYDWKADVSSGWQVAGTGDFDGNGRLDVLWYQPKLGALSIWFGNATARVARAGDLSRTAAETSGWKVVGTGDFDKDSKTDILWHHAESGELSVWFIDGTTVLRDERLSLPTSEATGFKVRGTGDFNQDGAIDVLWHHAETGAVVAWFLSGTRVVGGAHFSWVAPPAEGWELVGTGNIDHDSQIDLVWYRASDGAVASWNLDGMKVKGRTWLNWKAPAASGWKIVSR